MNLGTYSFPKRLFAADPYIDTDLVAVAGADILAGDLVVNSPQGNTPLAASPIAPWTGINWSTMLPSPTSTPDTLQGSITQINATVSSRAYGVAAWPDGDFVAISGDSTGNWSYTTYNSTGTVKIATTSGNGAVTSSWPGSDVCVLPNGNFVVVWNHTNNQVSFQILSRTGATIVSATTVESGGSYTQQPKVAALANGGFAVIYYDGTNTKVRGYNAAGSPQYTTTVEATASYGLAVTGLPSGDVVAAYVRSSDNYTRFARLNSAGTLQGSVTTVVATATNGCAVSAIPNGRFVVSTRNSTSGNLLQYFYSSTGTQISGGDTGLSVSSTMRSAVSAQGSIVVASYFNNNVGFHRFTGSGVYQASTLLENQSLNAIIPVFLPNEQLIIEYPINGGVTKFARCTTGSCLVMGVAVASASSGSQFRIRSMGDRGQPITMPLRVNAFPLSTAFDHRTNGGTAGVILNNTALLRGF